MMSYRIVGVLLKTDSSIVNDRSVATFFDFMQGADYFSDHVVVCLPIEKLSERRDGLSRFQVSQDANRHHSVFPNGVLRARISFCSYDSP